MNDVKEPRGSASSLIANRRAFLGGLAGISASAALSGTAWATGDGDLKAEWIVTTKDLPWRNASGVDVTSLAGPPDVFLGAQQQTIEGFGACFNELGWDALSLVKPDARQAIFHELFGADGAAFTICRMPVGANDFSRDWYSYDEAPGDFALDHFSAVNDEKTLIPFIKSALHEQPSLELWASPWSPPSWMKRNGHYASVPNQPGWPANGLQPSQIGREGTDMFIVEPRYLDAYARYFGRFIDAYRGKGIRVGKVMPQNEFNSAQPFPSCTWTPEGLAQFIPYLGEQMCKRDVDIFFGTLERPDDGLFEKVLQDPAAGPYLKGVGVQWAGKDAIPFIHRRHPKLAIYQSEQECGDGRNDWRYCRYAWSLMKHYLRNGATAYQYWNMALIDGGISRWGWAQNSLITVDEETGRHRFNPEYWLMKHFSHFVKPGAVRIDALSFTGYDDVLAFRNPNQSCIIVAHNPLSDPMPIRIAISGKELRATLPADSFNSFRLN